jgi:hypothetical protein
MDMVMFSNGCGTQQLGFRSPRQKLSVAKTMVGLGPLWRRRGLGVTKVRFGGMNHVPSIIAMIYIPVLLKTSSKSLWLLKLVKVDTMNHCNGMDAIGLSNLYHHDHLDFRHVLQISHWLNRTSGILNHVPSILELQSVLMYCNHPQKGKGRPMGPECSLQFAICDVGNQDVHAWQMVWSETKRNGRIAALTKGSSTDTYGSNSTYNPPYC